MSTNTISVGTVDEIALTDAANQRVLRVEDAIRRGFETQGQLMEHLTMPKTTLINTLAWLVEQGRVVKHTAADRRVRYTHADVAMTRDLMNARLQARQPQPNPERIMPRTPENASAMDTLTAVPSWLKKVRPIPAQPQASSPAERPAGARSPRLAKGAQERMILAYLAEHPNDAFSPYELGRLLAPANHKPLGVRDACARLAADGMISVVQAKPVRYGHCA